MDRLVAMLRAAGDPTRLRLLLLLRQAELTVSELIEIVGQSQPRVSRHLKLLGEAGLLERFKEGSWVFYRAADRGKGAELGAALAALADPQPGSGRHRPAGACAPDARRRRGRLLQGQCARNGSASAPCMRRKKMSKPPSSRRIDGAADPESAGCRHRHGPDAGTAGAPCAPRRGRRCQPGNAGHRARPAAARKYQATRRCAWPIPIACLSPATRMRFDAVLFHQVLHYLDDPGAAVAEAARVMAPGGRLLIADFAPHELEFLRDDYAHRRLGFSDREVEGWFASAGLKPGGSETIAPRVRRKTHRQALARHRQKRAQDQRGRMSLKDLIANRTARSRCRSNSRRPRPRRRKHRCGPRSSGWSRWRPPLSR